MLLKQKMRYFFTNTPGFFYNFFRDFNNVAVTAIEIYDFSDKKTNISRRNGSFIEYFTDNYTI